jgi:uncharacterized protein (TIGR02145 family)
MRKLILTTAAVAAAICLAGCSKKLTVETVSETPNTLADSGDGWEYRTVKIDDQTALESVPETPSALTDERDGKTYRTVKIGNQTWMAENLNYLPKGGGGWSCHKYGDSASDGCWCYGRSADSCKKYGMLYSWSTAVEVCPAGYHLPSNEEWDELLMAVGSGREKMNDEDAYESDEYRPIDGLGAGKKLKAKSGWALNDYCKETNKKCRVGDGNGTDEYGFSALPGGAYASLPGKLSGAGKYGSWWAASEEVYGAHFRYMRYYTDDVDHGTCPWPDAKSVRCVADNKRHDDSVRTALIARDKEWREKLEKISGYFTDLRDGMKYRTVKIGGRRWMAENLNYKPPKDNSWCYDNVDSNCVKYGRLYDWNTAKKVCPAGYHLPSNKEWDALGKAAGGEQSDNGFGSYYWSKAGRKLKAIGGWKNYRGEKGLGTDDFGFSALPGGSGNPNNDNFYLAGNAGYWWTATAAPDGNAYIKIIGSDDNLDGFNYDKGDGLSVRCVADNP